MLRDVDDRPQVHSLAEAETHIASLTARIAELERLHRKQQDWIDTFLATPTWKRWVFILDGWPGHRLTDSPSWRPWRRWWVS